MTFVPSKPRPMPRVPTPPPAAVAPPLPTEPEPTQSAVNARLRDVFLGLQAAISKSEDAQLAALWPDVKRRLKGNGQGNERRPEVTIALVGGTGAGIARPSWRVCHS